MTTQKQALEAALSALESERIMAADAQGNYTVEVTPKRILDAIEKVKAALAEPEREHFSYSSTQATNCAGCGKHKHTPLRIDAMGGYVCLTCIDQKLGSILGEFGYPEPQPREWQELSEEEALIIFSKQTYAFGVKGYVVLKDESREKALNQYREISAALRAKNGG